MNRHDHAIHRGTRTIYLMDEDIDAESAAKFIKNLDMLPGAKPITVRLATSGGDESCGLAMYEAMIKHPADITIVASGEISSVGVLLLQGGKKRIVSPTTSLMYHVGTVEVGEMAPEEAARTLDNHAVVGNLIDDIIHPQVHAKTGKTRKQFDTMVKESFFLIGQEIVDMGLADECK